MRIILGTLMGLAIAGGSAANAGAPGGCVLSMNVRDHDVVRSPKLRLLYGQTAAFAAHDGMQGYRIEVSIAPPAADGASLARFKVYRPGGHLSDDWTLVASPAVTVTPGSQVGFTQQAGSSPIAVSFSITPA